MLPGRARANGPSLASLAFGVGWPTCRPWLAGHAGGSPGEDGLVARLDEFDVGEVGASIVAPVKAELEKDAYVAAADGAERCGILAAVAGAGLGGFCYRVEHRRPAWLPVETVMAYSLFAHCCDGQYLFPTTQCFSCDFD